MDRLEEEEETILGEEPLVAGVTEDNTSVASNKLDGLTRLLEEELKTALRQAAADQYLVSQA